MTAREPQGICGRLGGAVALAVFVSIWAGCAADAPAPAPPTMAPQPQAASSAEDAANAESTDEPEEASSEESQPAPVHTAPPKPPVVHKKKHKKKPKPKPPPAPAPAASAPKPAPPPKPKVPSVHPIGPEETMSVLGKKVVDADGNELGRVVNIVVDNRSHVRALVVDFGGFLGVGNRQIAVSWDLLEFRPQAGDKSLVLKVSRDEVETAPEFQESIHPSELEGPAAAAPAPAHSGK